MFGNLHLERELSEIRKELAGLRSLILKTKDDIIMATDAQIAKLKTDIAALLTAAANEITAAIARAQNASPDPAIDALDTQVTTTTQNLTDAAAALNAGTALPPPVTPAA